MAYYFEYLERTGSGIIALGLQTVFGAHMSRVRPYEDLDTNDRDLVDAAFEASFNAYAPYSGFAVGAAVRTQSGVVHTGANMENASYGLGICAEVSALAAANSAGDFEVETIAVVGHKFTAPPDGSQVVTPCGRCRQLIHEASQISRTDIRVLSCNGDLGEIAESNISELLGHAFGPKNLGLDKTWPGMRAQLLQSASRLRGAPRRARA